jgi:NAD(P)-dependent dehydrogenase (short-subunit alcohol dehydrogenase family)
MTRGGSFVFVSSNAALMPFLGFSTYCSGKAGLEQFVRCAANELGERGIRLNAVRPGLTRSGATGPIFDDPAALAQFVVRMPLGRAGEPVDISSAIRFLAGPESGWITGQSIAVDGGNELRGAPMSGGEAAMK